MKNLLYILLFLPSILLAQAPEGINYQALIRDASGVVVANQNVGIQLSLLQGSASGSAVYKENFSPTTNDFGLVNLQIGAGTSTLGTFSSIDWSNGTYFIETAVDVNSGTNYVVISTTQFMSVPYALYAKNSGLDSIGIQGMIDANQDFDADTTNELQTLSYINDTLSISGGNYILLSNVDLNTNMIFFDSNSTNNVVVPDNIDGIRITLAAGSGGTGGGNPHCSGNYVVPGGQGGLGGLIDIIIKCQSNDTIMIVVGDKGVAGNLASAYCSYGQIGSTGGHTSVFKNGTIIARATGGSGGSGGGCSCGYYGTGNGQTGSNGGYNIYSDDVILINQNNFDKPIGIIHY